MAELSINLRGAISLKKLSLIDIKIGPVGAEQVFHHMAWNCSITELKVDRNKFRKNGSDCCTVDAIPIFLKVNACLKHLSMSHCDLGNSGLKLICDGLATNKTVKYIGLSNNDISDLALLERAFYQGVVALKSIDLSKNNINDHGAKTFAHGIRHLFSNQRLIKDINLSHNMIGPDGAYFLGEVLIHNP